MSRKSTKKTSRRRTEATPLVEAVNSHPLEGVRVSLTYKNEVQRRMGKLIAERDIVVCAGSPGTGKTIVACAEALTLMRKNPGLYKQIFLVKSVTSLRDEELGYLKGTLEEKMEPYVYSFISNMEKLVPPETVRAMRSSGMLQVLPIAYLRGANLDNCIVLVDEAQNISLRNMRTILTRVGSNCKMVILGDTQQSDMRDTSQSALGTVAKMFSDGAVAGVGVVEFGDEHIVRNPIVAQVEAAFKSLIQ